MAKSLCLLLMQVNHALVANFSAANMSFYAIRENKILAKISGFTVYKLKSHLALYIMHSKTCKNGRSHEDQNLVFQWEDSAILLTFIKLPFVINIFVLSIFEWTFYTGFTVFVCSDITPRTNHVL